MVLKEAYGGMWTGLQVDIYPRLKNIFGSDQFHCNNLVGRKMTD